MKRSCGTRRLQPPSAYTQPMRPRAPSPSTCSPLSASFATALLASRIMFIAWRIRTKSDRTPGRGKCRQHSPTAQSIALRKTLLSAVAGLTLATIAGGIASAADAYMPIVMPITGFLSVEGGSQRNGAVMALEQAPGGLKVDFPIFDTGTSATGAATALDKALSSQKATAAAVTVFGTEMVAMMPIAAEYKVPLLTISGLAEISEKGNPYIFRFLPNDREIKVAHARYVVEVMKKTKVALISDTTAYGQGGFALLQEDFAKLGTKPVFEDNSIAPDTKDMSPLLTRVMASGADVIVLHAVSTPTTLITKQVKSTGLNIPIVN